MNARYGSVQRSAVSLQNLPKVRIYSWTRECRPRARRARNFFRAKIYREESCSAPPPAPTVVDASSSTWLGVSKADRSGGDRGVLKDCNQLKDEMSALYGSVQRSAVSLREGPGGRFHDEGMHSACVTSPKFLSCKNLPHG